MAIPERTRPDVGRDGGAKDGARPVSYDKPTDADRIRELILRTGMSQRAIARELEVDDRTVRYWCKGDVKPARMVFLALERLIDMRREVR